MTHLRDSKIDSQGWIRRLPKAEFHLHMEGTIPWQMVRDSPGEPLPPQPEWHAPGYRFADFADFGRAMSLGNGRVLVTADAFGRVARQHFQRLASQNVRYAEVSFGLGGPIKRGYAFTDVVPAILNAAPEGMTVRVFVGFRREDVFSDEVLHEALTMPDVAGIDLHGDERTGSFDHLIEVYAEARRRGLRTKAHAGELRGPASVVDVVEKLQPQRIQHGVTAAQDDHVLALLAERQIVLDMCPTSNVALQVVPDMPSYPIRPILDHGIGMTINTDDPAIFGCTLTGEWLALVEHGLLTLREVAAMQRAAFAKADLENSERAAIQQEIDALVAELDAAAATDKRNG